MPRPDLPRHARPVRAVVVVASLLGGRLSDRTGRRKVFVFAASVVYGLAMFVIAVASRLQRVPRRHGDRRARVRHVHGRRPRARRRRAAGPDERRQGPRRVQHRRRASLLARPAVAPAILAVGGGSYAVLYAVAGGCALVGAAADPARQARPVSPVARRRVGAGHEAGADSVQVRHEPVDDDRDRDGGEDEGAQHRRQGRQPVAQREVDDGERREDGQPDHQRQLVLGRWRHGRGAVCRCRARSCCSGAMGRGAAASKSRTALRTSSSTRSALMAMAAADPSPAAVMTWARGLATLPATQTPGTLVRPVASVTDPPVLVDVAAEADEEVVVRDEARWHEQRGAGDGAAVVHLDTATGGRPRPGPGSRCPRRSRSPGPPAASARRRSGCPAGRRARRRRSTDGRSVRSGRPRANRPARRVAGHAPRSRGSRGSAARRVPTARADPGCRAARRAGRSPPADAAQRTAGRPRAAPRTRTAPSGTTR